MQNKYKFFFIVSAFLLMLFSNCASYTYSLNNYKPIVSFGNEVSKGEKSRRFEIERKVTWALFDLWKIQKFDLTDTLEQELPNAKKIYNLRIESAEGPLDSVIRLVSTGAQIWAFVTNRPVFFSRRTIIIAGDVVE